MLPPATSKDNLPRLGCGGRLWDLGGSEGPPNMVAYIAATAGMTFAPISSMERIVVG